MAPFDSSERERRNAEARRSALPACGGSERVKQERRDSWGVRLLETLLQDMRYAARSLRANPGFASVVVATFALGIGANTAIFSLVNAVLLRPLPYRHGELLVRLRQAAPGAGLDDIGFSPLEVRDLREQSRLLDGVVEYHSMTFTLLGGGEPRLVQSGVVSWNFFDVLGVKPSLGRAFLSSDEGPQANAVLLVSAEFWREHLGADPGVVGRTFEMNDRIHTVIGVLPPLPGYPDANDVFMPTSACPFRSQARVADNRQARMLNAFGRMRPGVSLEAAQAELATVAARVRGQYPEAYPGGDGRVDLLPLREQMVKTARPTFLVLLGTVTLVLLIACANVANLIIARLAGRERELAVRAALGAGRARLVRQLLTESTLFALAGGALGLLLAAGGLQRLSAFTARFTPRASEVSLDGRVLAFTLLLSLLTGLLAGSLPGLPPWRRLAAALGDSGRSSAGLARSRLRGALVVAQLGCSFVLLIGAALMLRSLAELHRVDPGFRTENVLALGLDLNWSKYLGQERRLDNPRLLAFHEDLISRARSRPGVVSVGIGWTFPLNSRFNNDGTFEIEGRPGAPGQAQPRAEARAASPEYFQAIGVPLLRGRAFDAQDRGDGPPVVVVSQGLARRSWGAEDPVGRRVSLDDGKSWASIVGVVGDVRNVSLERPPQDTVYIPFFQSPGYSCSYFVRSLGDPLVLGRELTQTIHALSPDTVVSVRTLEQLRNDSLESPRLTTLLLGAFAMLALAITATGLSGLVAFTVSQRTHEIGIRMTLGAEPRQVVAMLLRQGLSSVAMGLVLGVAGALALTRLVSGLLFGVGPTDLVCFVASGVVLVGVAGVACILPARRATTIDPQLALRSL